MRRKRRWVSCFEYVMTAWIDNRSFFLRVSSPEEEDNAFFLIIQGMNGAIQAKTVTYDFERLMEGATLLKCSEFGAAVIRAM